MTVSSTTQITNKFIAAPKLLLREILMWSLLGLDKIID